MDLLMILIISGFVILFIVICMYSASQHPAIWNAELFSKEYEESKKFENHIKEYKNFMKATGKNTLKDISLEFGESIYVVEGNVRRAIRINLLRGYYLCNQTGEILPINSNPFLSRRSIIIKENKSIKIKE